MGNGGHVRAIPYCSEVEWENGVMYFFLEHMDSSQGSLQ